MIKFKFYFPLIFTLSIFIVVASSVGFFTLKWLRSSRYFRRLSIKSGGVDGLLLNLTIFEFFDIEDEDGSSFALEKRRLSNKYQCDLPLMNVFALWQLFL